jgi:hypothetical protein
VLEYTLGEFAMNDSVYTVAIVVDVPDSPRLSCSRYAARGDRMPLFPSLTFEIESPLKQKRFWLVYEMGLNRDGGFVFRISIGPSRASLQAIGSTCDESFTSVTPFYRGCLER